MKIIIIGAGISGLATYLNLKKLLPDPSNGEPHDITIYESHALTPDPNASNAKIRVGGGLVVGPNGLRSLEKLDPALRTAVETQGFPSPGICMKNAWGWTLGWSGAYNDSGRVESMVICMRQTVWDCLKAKIPDEALVAGRRVKGVKKGEGGRVSVEFVDGGMEEADVVIGADGVRSVVREFVVGKGYPLHFENMLNIGGNMPSSVLPPQPKDGVYKPPQAPLVMTFGAQGFFGYGPSTTSPPCSSLPAYGPDAMWWSSWESPTLPTETSKTMDKDAIRAGMIERHKDWKDPVIQHCINHGAIRVLLPSFTTPELPRWHADGVILVGDAAHALPNTSGQGVSQCLEDAHALSYLLAHFLRECYHANPGAPVFSESEAIDMAARKYTVVRKPRVEYILAQGRRVQDMQRKKGWVGEWVMYVFMKILFPLLGAFLQKYLLSYDVEVEAQKAISMTDEEYAKTVSSWL